MRHGVLFGLMQACDRTLFCGSACRRRLLSCESDVQFRRMAGLRVRGYRQACHHAIPRPYAIPMLFKHFPTKQRTKT